MTSRRGRAGAAMLAALPLAALALALALWPGGRGGDRDGRPVPSAIRGVVLTADGSPLAGASVRLRGTRRRARTGADGRFVLRSRPGRRTLVAERAGYEPRSLATAVGGRPARVTISLSRARVPGPPNSADRLLFWIGCDELAELSGAELDEWRGRGVDGFVCIVGRLAGLGGDQAFAARPGARLGAPRYRLQRRLRDSGVLAALRRRGMVAYMGFYADAATSRATPFAGWFDDARWQRVVLPRVREFAAAARQLGFGGLGLDQELYGGQASWRWDHRGVGHPEPVVRAKVEQRGRQLMRAMLDGFPGVDLIAYYTQVPESWEELVQERVNGQANAFEELVQLDLWDGMTSVRGYRAVRWFDSIFYKTTHLTGADWDTALRHNAASVYSMLSRELSTWGYASSRLHVSPFAWIDEDGSDFARARSPEEVADQLAAFGRWGTGRTFGNYAHRPLGKFDYRPYLRVLRSASRPSRVDSTPPELGVDPPRPGRPLTGSASDNLAIRAVRWRDASGRGGVARTKLARGREGAVRWTVADVGRAQVVWIVAEDIKGLSTTRRVRI